MCPVEAVHPLLGESLRLPNRPKPLLMRVRFSGDRHADATVANDGLVQLIHGARAHNGEPRIVIAIPCHLAIRDARSQLVPFDFHSSVLVTDYDSHSMPSRRASLASASVGHVHLEILSVRTSTQ